MYKKILFVVVILLQSLSAFAQVQPYQLKAKELLTAAVNDNQTVGIVAGFSVNGDILWQQGAGYRNLKSKITMDTSTTTRIASIAKPMTAVAIMQLYEQGKLSLDDPIQTYLPTYPKKKEGDITIRHLLQHSSGIDGYKNEKEQENRTNYPSLADAVSIFKDRNLVSAPGQGYNYSSYGYVVLGLIIEEVSGMSYEAYMQTNIWDKAKMHNTGVEYFGRDVANKSLLYHRDSRGRIKVANQTNLSDRVPGGGLYSTVSDMLRFGDALLSQSLIKDSTFNMMMENPNLKAQGNGYGMGWLLYGENPKYGNVYGHNGAQTGATTFLMLLPEQQTTIVVLANTSGAIQSAWNITVQLFDIANEAKN